LAFISKKKDPGLNVALYTNAKVDKTAGKTRPLRVDEQARIKKYLQFEDAIEKRHPGGLFI